MEELKYTGLKYILPEIHILINENNFLLRKFSFNCLMEFIELFNKYAEEHESEFRADCDLRDAKNRFDVDYEFEDDVVYIKHIFRKNSELKRYYMMPMYKNISCVFSDIHFIQQAKMILHREKSRQQYEETAEELNKANERLTFLQKEIKKYKHLEGTEGYRRMEVNINKANIERDELYHKLVKLEFESCNHILVQTYRDMVSDIEINKDPHFHRARFEYRCVKCGLTNKVYLSGEKRRFGPVGEVMWELTEDLSNFSGFVYNDLNNSYIISKPKIAEEIYKEVTKYSSVFDTNLEIIQSMRSKVEEREKGTSRVREAK